jgi:bud site selection protein 20
MPGKSRNMGTHKSKGSGTEFKTKRRKRDVDQIYEEIKPENVEKTVKELTVYDEDRPGLGQFYCLTCARYFMNNSVLEQHGKTKEHKKR